MSNDIVGNAYNVSWLADLVVSCLGIGGSVMEWEEF